MAKTTITVSADYSGMEIAFMKELGVTPEVLATNLAKKKKQEAKRSKRRGY